MPTRETKSRHDETTRLSPPGDESSAEPGAGTHPPFPDRADAGRSPFLGSELDGYVIEAEVGRGGMGVVYRAFHPRLRRHVALKLMHQRSTAVNLRRFRDEAQVTAQLQHPSIVPIYDVGQTKSGEIYYTMRLVVTWPPETVPARTIEFGRNEQEAGCHASGTAPSKSSRSFRQAEVELGRGMRTPQVCKKLGIKRADVLPLAKGIRRPTSRPSEAAEGARAREPAAEEAGGRPGPR